MTMTLVSTVTVGAGGAANITFSSIAQTGTDLLVVLSGRSTTASANASFDVTPNGTSSNLSARGLRGTGSSTGSGTYSSTIGAYGNVIPADLSNVISWGNASIYIANYSSTSSAKYFSIEAVGTDNVVAAQQAIVAGLWNSTSAITSLVFTTSGNWQQNTTASLYTITKGSGGATAS